MHRSQFSSSPRNYALFESLENRNLYSATTVGVDPAFRGGSVVTHFDGIVAASATRVIVLKDGRALVSGYGFAHGGTEQQLFAVYNKDGTLSNRFSGDGKLVLPDATQSKLGENFLTIQQLSDGNILLAGSTSLVKLKLDGTIDTTFGKNGFVARTIGTQYGVESDALLANGVIRDVSYLDGVIRLQDVNAKGQVTHSVRRTVNLADGGGVAAIDASGVTLYGQTHLYRYASDLSKFASFATGGTLDLTPAFDQWAAAHGPFTDPGSSDQTPVTPDFSLGGTFDAKTGYGLVGASDDVSPNANSMYPRGEGDEYTPLVFTVSLDGKKVTVDSGSVNGKLLAHTAATTFSTGGGGESSRSFLTQFTRTDNTRASLLLFANDTSSGSNDAAEAADGSFFIVGEKDLLPNGDYEQQFVVVHTTVV